MTKSLDKKSISIDDVRIKCWQLADGCIANMCSRLSVLQGGLNTDDTRYKEYQKLLDFFKPLHQYQLSLTNEEFQESRQFV